MQTGLPLAHPLRPPLSSSRKGGEESRGGWHGGEGTQEAGERCKEEDRYSCSVAPDTTHSLPNLVYLGRFGPGHSRTGPL